jgi:hypothetical protein
LIEVSVRSDTNREKPGREWIKTILVRAFHMSAYLILLEAHALHIAVYPSFTDVMVSEPPTALSLKKETLSLLSFTASVYSNGR